MTDDPTPTPSLALDLPPGAVVTAWVAVVEYIDADGALQLCEVDSPDLPWWQRRGLVEALPELDALSYEPAADTEDGE